MNHNFPGTGYNGTCGTSAARSYANIPAAEVAIVEDSKDQTHKILRNISWFAKFEGISASFSEQKKGDLMGYNIIYDILWYNIIIAFIYNQLYINEHEWYMSGNSKSIHNRWQAK